LSQCYDLDTHQRGNRNLRALKQIPATWPQFERIRGYVSDLP